MAVRLVVRRAGPNGARDGDDGVQYEFEQPRLVIGRSASSDLRLPALTVSDLHATLEQTERGYALRDMRSTNGTRVNGTALVPDRSRALHEGDTLQVGEFVIDFHTGGPVSGLTSPERTVSLAKRLLRESREGQPGEPARLHWRWMDAAMGSLELPAPPARWLLGTAADAELRVSGGDAPESLLELELGLEGLRVRALADAPLVANGRTLRQRLLRDGDRVQCAEAELELDDPADRALRALEGQADAPLSPTAESPATIQDDGSASESGTSAAESSAAPSKPPEPPPPTETPAPKPSKRPSLGPDALVYTLALVVLAASALGMLWLIGE